MATQIYKQQHTFVSMGRYMATRNLCHALKNGNRDAIATAARMMADSVKAMANGQSCVLIPMPGHRGGTGYTLDLCRQISDLTGIPTADILTGNRHMSLNYAKRNDVLATGVPVVISLKSPLPKERVILVDNVLDTGHTAGAAIKAIGRDDTMLAVLSNTVKFKRNFAIEFKQFDNSAILANNNLNASTYAMSNMGNSIEMAAEDRKQDNGEGKEQTSEQKALVFQNASVFKDQDGNYKMRGSYQGVALESKPLSKEERNGFFKNKGYEAKGAFLQELMSKRYAAEIQEIGQQKSVSKKIG